jgi:glyoxylase-like metal-dependent hydrolase (beta-lactamase superfamily II)
MLRHGAVTLIRLDRTFLGRRLMSAYCYSIDGLLVDTAFARARAKLTSALLDLPIHSCVITHHHEDHSGNGAWIRQWAGVTPRTHELSRPFLAGGFHLQPYRRFFWGSPGPFSPAAIGPRVETDRYGFEVIDLEGHTHDMIGLFEPREGWLLSGDLFVQERPTHFMPNDEYGPILASLERALALDFDTLLCAHSPRLKGGRDALRKKREYLLDLGGRARDLLDRGLSEEAVRDRLLGREDYVSRFTAGHFSKLNLIASIARHGH